MGSCDTLFPATPNFDTFGGKNLTLPRRAALSRWRTLGPRSSQEGDEESHTLGCNFNLAVQRESFS